MMALRQSRWMAAVACIGMVGMLLTLGACGTGQQRVQAREVMFELDASRTQVLAGENVTLIAQSENVLGRDAQIEWDASGGELFTEEGGRIARAYFDEPGTYIVQANLILDGRLTRSATTTITVESVD